MSDSINFFVGLKLVALGQGAVTPMLRKMFRENSEKFYQNVQTKLKKNGEFFTVGHPLIGEPFLYILGEGGLAKHNLFKRK